MRSRRQSHVITAGEDFLAALRASGLLPSQTVESLAAERVPQDPRAWASDLIERGLLTGYQAEQVLAGNAEALVLGQYRILDALGAGGMGRVYKAEHVLMRRVVALKVVGSAGPVPASADGAEPHSAFLREIEVVARLSHPNIVAAFDAGEENGVRFLVMEFVDGVDLDRWVRTVGPLSPRRACEYARQTAVALHHAFERGVLHRDVKPANLLVESAEDPRSPGRVKVLDLGLALSTRGSDDGTTDAVSHLSGTPDYIAPEVAHNPDGRDVRSDLYSLGCTLYYLLSGRVPFPGGTWTEKLLRHQYDAPVPLRELAPAVPAAVAAVAGRLMAKAPADRYDTPAAAARALEEWLALGEDPPAANSWCDADDAAPARDSARAQSPSEPAGPTASLMPPVTLGPPSDWDLRAPAPESARARRPGPSSWFFVIGLAVLTGLGVAWLVRSCLVARAVQTPTPPEPGFVLHSNGTTHATLGAALAEAVDGDTVTIQGDGPFTTGPLVVTGKALTLRGAPGSHPVFQFDGLARAWQALLATDRPLELEGIELRHAPDGEPASLVVAAGASLRLVRCRVAAPGRSAPVVARGVSRVELCDCALLAGSVALCAEVAPGTPCRVVLCANRVEVGDPGGAAVSVWAGERRSDPVTIEMDRNEVRGNRILSLRGLTAGVRVTARANRFDFGEGLLCLNDFGAPDGWRRFVTWSGEGNGYNGSGDWLRVDGTPAGVRGPQAWGQTWGE